MGVKLYKAIDAEDNVCGYRFKCPGCGSSHVFRTTGKLIWKFNGDMEKPTFKPSLLNIWPGGKRRCHLFVTDGKIEYLGDCTHHLAGQTIEMEDIDTD